LAENSGATCWPRTMSPAQREHTIGGNLLGGFVCLRRTPRRAELFGVGSDMVALDDAQQRGTDLKKMMTEANYAEVTGAAVHGARAKIASVSLPRHRWHPSRRWNAWSGDRAVSGSPTPVSRPTPARACESRRGSLARPRSAFPWDPQAANRPASDPARPDSGPRTPW
jgi:hypothetical protein